MGHVIIDIVLLVVGILIILKFTISGFLKSLLSTCKLLVSVAIAFLLRVPVAHLFGNIFFDGFFVNGIYNALRDNDTTSSLVSLLYNDSYATVLAKFEVDTVKLGQDMALLQGGERSDELLWSISQNAGSGFSLMVCSVIAVILIFIVSLIGLSLLMPIIEKITTAFDGVKTANRVLGLAFGVIIATLTLWGISLGLYAVISYIGPFTQGAFDVQTLDRSMILGFFRKINLIDWLVAIVN